MPFFFVDSLNVTDENRSAYNFCFGKYFVMMDHAVCLLVLVQNCSVHFPFVIDVPTDYVYIILGNVLKPLERYLQIAVKSNARINLWRKF